MRFAAIPLTVLLIFLFSHGVSAQKTEITISFSEQFFDALLDAIFQHAAPPEFSLSTTSQQTRISARSGFAAASAPCNEAIKLLRENDGVRTAVRFRDGQIVAPLAFQGNYNPPLIGCVPFAGVAEALLDLEFDRAGQRLVARAKVRNVALSGTGGVGGSVIARLVQSSIDKRVNPIEIVKTDKVTFALPVQNSGSLKMKATGFTHEIVNGQLNIRVGYEFLKN